MKRSTVGVRLAIIAGLLLCPCIRAHTAAQSGSATDAGDEARLAPNGDFYALVIGINDYAAPLPKLATAVSDARSIAQILAESYGFQVKLLVDQDATRSNILRAIAQYRNKLNENDNLLIYYAGHGISDRQADKAYWIPFDAESVDSPNRISADDITTGVRVQAARHVLIISDSCYSGGLTRGADSPVQSAGQIAFLNRMLTSRSRTLMASGGDEPVSDGGGDGHSVFAYAILRSLKQTDQAVFTASDLFYGSVRQQVAGRSNQLPEYSIIRNSSHYDGDFVFMRAATSKARVTPEPPPVAATPVVAKAPATASASPIKNANPAGSTAASSLPIKNVVPPSPNPSPNRPPSSPSFSLGVHGHVNNAAGFAISNATVRFTTDRTTDPKSANWLYTFPVNATGDYRGSGIAPNTYLVVVEVNDTIVDFFSGQTFRAGEDKLLNFDMTRQEFIDRMSPEQKKELEDYKTKLAAATETNKTIGNLNGLLKQARDANAAGNFEQGLNLIQQATNASPNQPLLWVTQGDSEMGIADAAAKTARAENRAVNSPPIQQKYRNAVASYKKAIDLNAASSRPSGEIAATASNQMGSALGKSGDLAGAGGAFEAAVQADPANAAKYYFNEAAVFYNGAKPDDAVLAAEKSISVDPTKAEAYYIKGQALVQKATVDPKTFNIVAPPGCVEAYRQYLALAPNGTYAAQVREILAGIGTAINSTSKKTKKS